MTAYEVYAIFIHSYLQDSIIAFQHEDLLLEKLLIVLEWDHLLSDADELIVFLCFLLLENRFELFGAEYIAEWMRKYVWKSV